jgi:DNA-binding NarL/FixJ family response regulator
MSTPALSSEPARPPIRILIADDHPMIRDGIEAMVSGNPDMCVVAKVGTGTEAVAQYHVHLPDITLMDLQMPDMNGIDAIAAICADYPAARIIVLTTYRGDVAATRALRAGASGYILKNMLRKDLLNTIVSVHGGARLVQDEVIQEIAEHRLSDTISPRESEVLQLVAQGNTNRAIAARMRIKEETVKTHMKAILTKLGVNDRTHAVTVALQRGIISF